MTVSPPFEDFNNRYDEGVPQVVIRRVISDLDTPVSAYLKLAKGRKNTFLLESVEGGEKLGRYSIIGIEPDLIWRVRDGRAEIGRIDNARAPIFREDAKPALESLKAIIEQSTIKMPEDAPPMAAGVFGYFGYDIVRETEFAPRRGGRRPPKAIDAPDAVFVRPTLVAIFDNIRQEISLVAPVRPDERSAREAYARAENALSNAVSDLAAPLQLSLSGVDAADEAPEDIGAPLSPASNTTPEDYVGMVRRAKEHIAAGDIFQVVLSQRFEAPFRLPPIELYRALRRTNPSPFLFFLDFDDLALVGSSPEILVRVRNNEITIRPIAGTRARGKNAAEDEAMARELLADPKERAEHLMLLDLGRNDVGRSATIGSVKVTEQFVIERYSHVMHIVSNVVGALAPGLHPVDAVAAGFPAGTVSGAPKIRAMEIIDDLEREARGPYGGCIGYFSADGAVDTCIALRTAVVQNGKMYVQAGAGIVADSDPALEHIECVNKARALFAAARATQPASRQAVKAG